MNIDELGNELSKLGLRMTWDFQRGKISVGDPTFANPLLWFEPFLDKDDYVGSVSVKSINAHLFSERQIKNSLILIDSFMMTELSERDLEKYKVKD